MSSSGVCSGIGPVGVTGDSYSYSGVEIVECGTFGAGLLYGVGSIFGTKTILKACCKYTYNGGSTSTTLPGCQ